MIQTFLLPLKKYMKKQKHQEMQYLTGKKIISPLKDET